MMRYKEIIRKRYCGLRKVSHTAVHSRLACSLGRSHCATTSRRRTHTHGRLARSASCANKHSLTAGRPSERGGGGRGTDSRDVFCVRFFFRRLIMRPFRARRYRGAAGRVIATKARAWAGVCERHSQRAPVLCASVCCFRGEPTRLPPPMGQLLHSPLLFATHFASRNRPGAAHKPAGAAEATQRARTERPAAAARR
jgi:hypothetical protein